MESLNKYMPILIFILRITIRFLFHVIKLNIKF